MMHTAFAHIKRVDAVLARHIKKIGPMTLEPKRMQSPYASLAESIAYQQLTGKAAATIWGRVLALYPPRRVLNPEAVLDTPDVKLRAAGLSTAKVLAIKDLSAKAIEGVVPTSRAIEKMSDEEIIERLTSIRGIGEWTVQMMLIFKLGRPDVLPTADYGVRKGFAAVYGLDELPKPKELLRHGEIWRPFRTIGAWYLWRALDKPLVAPSGRSSS